MKPYLPFTFPEPEPVAKDHRFLVLRPDDDRSGAVYDAFFPVQRNTGKAIVEICGNPELGLDHEPAAFVDVPPHLLPTLTAASPSEK